MLNGRLKHYNPSRNIDHFDNLGEINNIKKSKTVICLRKNRKLKIDTNNDIIINRNKKHNLSYINNKSSNCITPGSFNPLINYKIEEKKHKKSIETNYYKNKDHFFHMNPTEIYKYKPQLKRVFNSLSFSRNEKTKKTGKKLFSLKNVESKEDFYSINTFTNRIKYLNNRTNTFFTKNLKVYEYEEPVISNKDVKKRKN